LYKGNLPGCSDVIDGIYQDGDVAWEWGNYKVGLAI
jgi:hypothetical protein